MTSGEPEWTKHTARGDSRRTPRQGLARMLALLLAVSIASPVAAQDQTLLNQPTAHYYHAQGSAVKVAWTVEPLSIPEDGELTATLTITGAANPQDIVRPGLKKLPEFQSRFVITDAATPPSAEPAREVKFVYQLRPRNRSVDQVPLLEFHYFNPTASAGKKQFPLAIARAVPITVTESLKVEPPATPLVAPNELFVIARGPELLDRQSVTEGFRPWLAVGLLGPLGAVGWYWAWRRLYPDAARQARLRRSWAGRRAHDALRRAHACSDPAAAISAAVLAYLHSRFPFPSGAATPGEIEAALVELKVPTEDCLLVAEFFRNCDAARFAPTGDVATSLAADAEAIVNRLEEA